MSRVIDHTALTELLSGGQYLRAVTAHYGTQHRFIAVPLPTVAVAVAVANAGGKAETLHWYLSHTAVVKIIPFELDDAIGIGRERFDADADAGPGEWLLTAAVVHAAHSLHLPILTHKPERYARHDVEATRLP